jgi:hypothetical protein
MSEILAVPGANFILLLPDDRTNVTLNGSVAGNDGIATTDFEGMLMENGEVVATNLAALEASPFFMTIDNVSGTFGLYKVNLTLPNRSKYDLFLRHTADLITVRHEALDTQVRHEVLSLARGNTRYDFTLASGGSGAAQNAADGVPESLRIRNFFPGTTTVVSDVTLLFYYTDPGDTNPESVRST